MAMKSRSVVFLSILSALAFSAAIGLSAWRIALVVDARSAEAESSFAFIEKTARALLADPSGLRDERWRGAMKAEYRRSQSLLSVAVRSETRGIRYLLPADNPYLAPTGDEVAYAVPTLTVALRTATFASGPELLSVDALYATIGQGELFDALLPGLVVAAAWTLLCLGFLGLAGLSSGRRSAPVPAGDAIGTEAYVSAEEPLPAGFIPDDVPPLARQIDGEDGRTAPETIAGIPDLAPEVFAETEATSLSSAPPDIEWFDDRDGSPRSAAPDEGSGAQPSSVITAASVGTAESVDTAESADATGLQTEGDRKPTGLYSPDTGLGWESYLGERLDAELRRSASFEQDLALVLVLYEEAAPTETAHVVCAKTAIDFFGFRDLSFERGERGFAFVLPNVDVDHALRMSEEFFKKATFVLKSYRDPLSYLDLHIGISSRAGRLIPAARLVTEAESALARAKQEHDSHIVAFVANVDKYRSFIASK